MVERGWLIGDVNMVKYLLSAGSEVDQPSGAGQTPLHLAALTKQPAIIDLLLDKGADLQVHQAIHYHHQPINVPTAGSQAFLMDYT
jgi:ankyrin repeat protein